MSNRGRPKKSIDELKKSGSYRPSRHGVAHEVAPIATGTIPCPPELTGPAAEHWARLMKALAGRVVAADEPVLVMACRWLAEEQRCREAIAALDPTSVEHGRALRSATAAAAAADRLLKGFALTPAMRAKLPPPIPECTDPRGGKFFGNGQRTPKRPQFALDRMFPNGPPHVPVRPADLDPPPPKKPNPSKES